MGGLSLCMTAAQIKALGRGDQVYWKDPDGEAASRVYTIATIVVDEDEQLVTITEPDGSEIQAYFKELHEHQ